MECPVGELDVGGPRPRGVELTNLAHGSYGPVPLVLLECRQEDVGPAFSFKRTNDDISSPARRPGGDCIPWLRYYWSTMVEVDSDFSDPHQKHLPGMILVVH